MEIVAKTTLLMTLAALHATAVGCLDTPQGRLVGRWHGRPDSVNAWAQRKATDEAARREREGLPPLSSSRRPSDTGDGSAEGGDATAAASEPPIVTDWEKLDFDIHLHFVDHDSVRMSLGGEQEIDGTWRVVSSKVDRVTIEIRTEPAQEGRPSTEEPFRTGGTREVSNDGTATRTDARAPQEKITSSRSNREVRRFLIRFEGEKKDRFTLTEEGADRFVGSLLFRRAKE